MGRPSSYTPEIAGEIVERLSKGEPLTVICGSDPKFPCDDTVRAWAEKDEAVSRAIARAREAGADHIAWDALKIADNTDEDPASRRVRADVRLKLLAKWDPKRYGDRMTLAGDKESPLMAVSDEQIDARLNELLAKRAG